MNSGIEETMQFTVIILFLAVIRLRERVLAQKAAKAEGSSTGPEDMGIHVEDNGEEKIYALTPQAKEWAKKKINGMKELGEIQKEEKGKPTKNENEENKGEAEDTAQIKDREERDETIPDDEGFLKLLENLKEDPGNLNGELSIDPEEFSAVDSTEPEIQESVEHKDSDKSPRPDDTALREDKPSEPEDGEGNEDATQAKASGKCLEGEEITNVEISTTYEQQPTEMDVNQELDSEVKATGLEIVQDRSLQISCSDLALADDECSQCSSTCRHQDEDDRLLYASCHNFLRLHDTTTMEEQTEGESRPMTTEELLGDIWLVTETVAQRSPSPSPLDDDQESDSDGQGYLRQLVYDQNQPHETESDIEELLENMDFEPDFQTYREDQLAERAPSPFVVRENGITARYPQALSMNDILDDDDEDDDDEDDDDEDDDNADDDGDDDDTHEADGAEGPMPAGAPMFGGNWMDQARRNIMNDEWDEVEEESERSEDASSEGLQESVSPLEDSDESRDESSLEEETVSSVSTNSYKIEHNNGLLFYEHPIRQQERLNRQFEASPEENQKREESSSSSSCSSLSVSSLNDPSIVEEIMKVPCYNTQRGEPSEITARSQSSSGGNASQTATASGIKPSDYHPQPREPTSEHEPRAALSTRPGTSSEGNTPAFPQDLPHLRLSPDTRATTSNESPFSVQTPRRQNPSERSEGAARQLRYDRETLAGGGESLISSSSLSSRRRETIFSARAALRSSHEAFVAGHNMSMYSVYRSPLKFRLLVPKKKMSP